MKPSESFVPRTAIILAPLAALMAAPAVAAPKIELGLPLGRNALQTNETIPLTVVRSDTAELTADTLTVTLTGEDLSSIVATFPAAAVPTVDGVARATEHLNLDVRQLRPGRYTVTVKTNGGSDSANIEVYSALRRSTYKLINWGTPHGAANQRIQGEDGLGFNTMYDKPGDMTEYIRAGVDVVPVNVMSGGHQMDLRSDADWSDPYVTRGGTRRVSRVAFQYRSFPNFIGINYYDEPGLTWYSDPVTKEWTPHGIPSQVRSFQSAFDRAAPRYNTVDPTKPADAAAWKEWASWKLGFMDAAWHEAAYGQAQVRPDIVSNTQSQYGWTAFTDGYYFNVVRSLSVVSGHGGYDDLNGGYFCPSYFLEMARARDRDRPNWYLPTWYPSSAGDLTRLENSLCFAVGIQGIMTPPPNEPTGNPAAKSAAIEGNHIMGRLGTIFDTMQDTPRPVALLYSMSNNLQLQTQDREVTYAHATKQGASMLLAYLAGQFSQQPVQAVVDEDVIDGTLAAKHKAVILASVTYLDPKVIQGLEEFAAGGGLVLKTSDTTVNVKGSIDLGVTPQLPEQAQADAMFKQILASANRNWALMQPFQTVAKFEEGAAPLAKALTAQLAKAGIGPVFGTDQSEIVAQAHGSGDVDYVFAINATNDRPKGTKLGILPATATLSLPADGRPIYDALTGTPLSEGKGAVFAPTGKNLAGKISFGPGEMRVFARTARPIGGVRLTTPLVSTNLTRLAPEDAPTQLSFSAGFVDAGGRILSGSVPMRVQVTDPLGVTRYDLYRATKDGMLALNLPLAANDAAGSWKVAVTELLSNKVDSAAFNYKPAARNGSIVGETPRAVMFPGEADHLFRFVRANQDVTIVPGAGGGYQAAAERLQKILAPWGVRATIMDVAQATKGRNLTEDEASTWIGLNYTPHGSIKAGDGNTPVQSGFAVRGAAILLGTAEDNPLIKALNDEHFLPYQAKKGVFPGQGRGFVAWQRDGIGPAQESVTLIAHDPAGINEAVGSFYEAAAGMQPLTRWTLPDTASVTPATTVVAAAAPAPKS